MNRFKPLVSLAVDGPPDEKVIDDLRCAFALSRYRTVHQDVAFEYQFLFPSLRSGMDGRSAAETSPNGCFRSLPQKENS